MFYAYKIQNLVTGTVYVGITADPVSRWDEHLANAFKSNLDTQLYHAMRHYGQGAFWFTILAMTVDPAYRWELETLLIEQYDSFEQGYNMTLGGNDRSNLKGSAAARDVLSGKHLGMVALTDPRWELCEIESVCKGQTNHQFDLRTLSIIRLNSVSDTK